MLRRTLVADGLGVEAQPPAGVGDGGELGVADGAHRVAATRPVQRHGDQLETAAGWRGRRIRLDGTPETVRAEQRLQISGRQC